MAIGGISYNGRRRFLNHAPNCIQVPVLFAIQSVENSWLPILRLFRPFDIMSWISISIVLTLAILVLLLLKCSSSKVRSFVVGGQVNRTPILNMLNICLGGSIPLWNGFDRRALSVFSKTMFVIWSFSNIILRGSYQGALYRSLQEQRPQFTLDTVEKVLASDCDIHISQSSIQDLDDYNIDPSRIHQYNASIQIMFKKLQANEISGAIYTQGGQLSYFNSMNSRNGIVYETKDRLFVMPLCLYFPKGSYLTQIVNSHIERYVKTGWTAYFFKKYATVASKPPVSKPEVMQLIHFAGIFGLAAQAVVLSSILLILERFSVHQPLVRRFIQFWTY